MAIHSDDLRRDNHAGALIIDALINPAVNGDDTLNINWNFLTPARNKIYYTFDVIHGTESPPRKSIGEFNDAQREAVQDILKLAGKLTGIKFVETDSGDDADIHFASADIEPSWAGGLSHGNIPDYTERQLPNGDAVIDTYSADSYVYLDNVELEGSNRTPLPGNIGYYTLLHEIGHVLGLKHPFQAQGLPTDPYVLPPAQDNSAYTVMSYSLTGGYSTTYGIYDWLALRWLYGNDGLGGASGNDKAGAKNDSLFGTDQVDDLLFGYNGKDFLAGFAGVDTLSGGNGQDVYFGGTGKDDYVLMEKHPAKDLIWISPGDSLISGFDTIKGFKLGGAKTADTLNLPSNRIALDGIGDGVDAADIHSHNIVNGLIRFDDNDVYNAEITLKSSNLISVFLYLQNNIAGQDTVVFNVGKNSYVFQDGGTQDVLVQLLGVVAQGLDTHGTMTGAVWLA